MKARGLLLCCVALLGACCQPQTSAVGREVLVPSVSSAPVQVESSSDAGSGQAQETGARLSTDAVAALQACTGTPSSAFASALRAIAGSTRSCYERALRVDRKLAGRLKLLLRVGTDGRVEAFSMLLDEPGNPALAECVEQKFREPSYPPPVGGCADAIIPLNFTPKSDDADAPDAG